MGEERVKTAFELAMEKIDAMPSLNMDELNEERKKESIAKGEAIAQRYLQNRSRKTDIKGEVEAIKEEQRTFAQQAAMKCLSDGISLTQPELNQHIFEGMSLLNINISSDSAQKQMDRIINDFIGDVKKAQEAIEKSETDNLKKEGISGSAVRLNLKANPVWHETYAQLSATYTGKLYTLQKSLLEA